MTEHTIGKICFIGGGNMARALIGGLQTNGYLMSDINVIEPEAEKRAQLNADFGVSVTEQLPSVAMADIVVLAVKPQQLRDLSIFLGSLLQKQLLISIAAGIRAKDIARWLGGYQSIIRVMPNTPAQIQLGVSALYVFYFIEAMQQAALELGLNAEQAKTLSLQTFIGASKLAEQSHESPATLRSQVTSKGGTTEQAILTMESATVKSSIIKAAKAAAARSEELGDILGKD